MRYNRAIDRMIGNDYPNVYSHGFVEWELDELEVGARVAMALDDPEQAWWELIGFHKLREQEREEARNTRNSHDARVGEFPPKHV